MLNSNGYTKVLQIIISFANCFFMLHSFPVNRYLERWLYLSGDALEQVTIKTIKKETQVVQLLTQL